MDIKVVNLDIVDSKHIYIFCLYLKIRLHAMKNVDLVQKYLSFIIKQHLLSIRKIIFTMKSSSRRHHAPSKITTCTPIWDKICQWCVWVQQCHRLWHCQCKPCKFVEVLVNWNYCIWFTVFYTITSHMPWFNWFLHRDMQHQSPPKFMESFLENIPSKISLLSGANLPNLNCFETFQPYYAAYCSV